MTVVGEDDEKEVDVLEPIVEEEKVRTPSRGKQLYPHSLIPYRTCGREPQRSWVCPRMQRVLQKTSSVLPCQERRWRCSMRVLVRFVYVVLCTSSLRPIAGEYWAQKAYGTSDNRGKMLRRDGFTLAEERYGPSLAGDVLIYAY